MPCYHPWTAPRETAWGAIGGKLPCGQCHGCRSERARQWALRCVHEAHLHTYNTFITLTYREPHQQPSNKSETPSVSLKYRDFQLFLKRARKKLGPFRFYMAGEYGEQFERPHFHACLFGVDFHDKYPWRKNHNGDQLYRSPTLELLWKHGNSETGAVTFQSAAYVARYVMKKITGDLATSHYTYLTKDGELINRTPEFNRMSNGGRSGERGIGYRWYEQFKTDVYPSDQCVANGREQKPPRYYDKLNAEESPDAHKRLQQRRRATLDHAEGSPERLKARETVAIAKSKLAPRKLA